MSGLAQDVDATIESFVANDKCEALRIPWVDEELYSGSWPHGEVVLLALTIDVGEEDINLAWRLFSAWRDLVGEVWEDQKRNCYFERDYRAEGVLFPIIETLEGEL